VQEVPGSSPAGDKKFLAPEKEGKNKLNWMVKKREKRNGVYKIRPFNIF